MSGAHDLQLEELANYFHLPIAEAAKEIGVCATVLKKICRKNNIPRWPHRKIKSINKMIATLENSLGKNSEDDERIREEIKTLVLHKDYVMKNPDTLVKNVRKRRDELEIPTTKKLKIEPTNKKPSGCPHPENLSYDDGYFPPSHVQPSHPMTPYYATHEDWPRMFHMANQSMYSYPPYHHNDVEYSENISHPSMMPTDEGQGSILANPTPSHPHHFEPSFYAYANSNPVEHNNIQENVILRNADTISSRNSSDEILRVSSFSTDSSSNSSSPNIVVPLKITTPPPIPEWYQEDKDNYLALQEKMGLV